MEFRDTNKGFHKVNHGGISSIEHFERQTLRVRPYLILRSIGLHFFYKQPVYKQLALGT